MLRPEPVTSATLPSNLPMRAPPPVLVRVVPRAVPRVVPNVLAAALRTRGRRRHGSHRLQLDQSFLKLLLLLGRQHGPDLVQELGLIHGAIGLERRDGGRRL